MTRRLFLAAAAAALLAACARPSEARASAPPGSMPNGLYKVVADPALEAAPPAVRYDPRLADPSIADDARWVLLDTTDYVPLVLTGPPHAVAQADGRLLLEVALTKDHVATLEGFTRRNLGGRAAVVIDGAPVSIHKVRSVVTGGTMKITRCTDRACERIMTKLVEATSPDRRR
jgi:hypothetical protein